MRVSLPNAFTRVKGAGNNKDTAISRSILIFRIVILLIIIGIILFGVKKYHHAKYDTVNKYVRATNAVDENINSLKNAKDLNSRRSLASNYVAKQEYAKAESTAKSVADQTKLVKDYMSLLTICAVHAVPDKQACIDYAVSNIKPSLDKLSFYDVYVAGSMLDDANDKKDAVVFYQRAYDIYDPAKVDIYTKTKDQIKQRIDALNA